MDPVSATIAIASSVASAGASIYSGIQQSKAYDAQSQAARIEGEIAGIRGKQISAQKRDELNRVLASIDTMRVSRGVGLDSPTSFAIRQNERERSRYARGAADLGTRLEQFRSNTAARGYSQAANSAYVGGFLNALPQLVSAAGDFSSAIGK